MPTQALIIELFSIMSDINKKGRLGSNRLSKSISLLVLYGNAVLVVRVGKFDLTLTVVRIS